MKPLIKIILLIAAFFASTFLIVRFTGILTVEQIEGWLMQAKQASPIYVGSIVAALLFADLFIAVPTLTIIILSGYFLGHLYGAIAALTGIMLAGICGHIIGRYYGDGILGFLVKDDKKRDEAVAAFKTHGFVMILLSRAIPILPEVTACLSGMTRMAFARFLIAWSLSTIPYILIASYAGSVSSLDKPMPAIFTAIGLSALLWVLWYFYHKMRIKSKF